MRQPRTLPTYLAFKFIFAACTKAPRVSQLLQKLSEKINCALPSKNVTTRTNIYGGNVDGVFLFVLREFLKFCFLGDIFSVLDWCGEGWLDWYGITCTWISKRSKEVQRKQRKNIYYAGTFNLKGVKDWDKGTLFGHFCSGRNYPWDFLSN